MEPQVQTFETNDSYVDNLFSWILAIRRIPFTNPVIFKTYSKTSELLFGDKEIANIFQDLDIDFETGLFDEGFANTGNLAVFIAEILPIQGDQDQDGVFATFNANNEAFFDDMNYGNYQSYFKENGIEQGKVITWQEAYDKMCELARKEQTAIPKIVV